MARKQQDLTGIKLETAAPINNNLLGKAIASLKTTQKKSAGAKTRFNPVGKSQVRQRLFTGRNRNGVMVAKPAPDDAALEKIRAIKAALKKKNS